MAGKKRSIVSVHKSTPHRLKKRYATKITATPRHAVLPPRVVSRSGSPAKEEIESGRDDFWSLPLPTSPAPSPPRPVEICPDEECTMIPSPNETQVFFYRKAYDNKDRTLRDALGRQVYGRHSFPAREVVIDRVYRTPSLRAQEAHGIEDWPAPPMEGIDDSARDQFNDLYHQDQGQKMSAVPTSPQSREPVHTAGRKRVTKRPRRLLFDQSKGAVKGDDWRAVEGQEEDTTINTALGAQGDTSAPSSSRKRRASKIVGVGVRRRIFSALSGSSKSDGLRMLTTSDESKEAEEKEEEEEGLEDAPSFSGDVVIVDDENSVVEADVNSTLEFEQQDELMEGLGDGVMEAGSELRMDGSDEEREEEEEVQGMEGNEEEASVHVEKDSSRSEETLPEERSDNRQEYDISDGMEGSDRQNDSIVGDTSLIDTTLPLDTVVPSIVDGHLRRLLAVCMQKDVMGMEEFMVGVQWGIKVGEGGYAEVFLVKRQWEEEKKVFKILPLTDDEDAGKFFGEVIISKELTRLRTGRNSTAAFAKLYRARVIKGLFPRLLSAAWEAFRETDEDAINEDNPESLGHNQMFLCLECEYGGVNLKKFPFSSILEIVSVYCQTALALAVAESEFKFEHRDLHEENVLVKRTEETTIQFSYDRSGQGDGASHQWTSVPTYGVKTTIIDFTLSRMTRKPESRLLIPDVDINHEIDDEICEQDESAEQYKVYKKMKTITKGNWSLYTPKSNVLWLRMQINWLIQENLNPKSALNKARVEATKAAKALNKSIQSQKVHPTRQSKRLKKSSSFRSDGEEERVEMSGEQWRKKLKEGAPLISKLRVFSKNVSRFESADDLVRSKDFASLLDLLKT